MSLPLAAPTIGPRAGAGFGTGALSGTLVCGRSSLPTLLWTSRTGALGGGAADAGSTTTGTTALSATDRASVVDGVARIVVSWVVAPLAGPLAITTARLPPSTATTTRASAAGVRFLLPPSRPPCVRAVATASAPTLAPLERRRLLREGDGREESGGLALHDRLHALERGSHVVVVGLAPEAAQQRPVDAGADVLGQLEVLRDVGATVGGLESVAPRVHRAPGRHHRELE